MDEGMGGVVQVEEAEPDRNKEKQNDLGTLSPLLVTLKSPKLYSLSMPPPLTAPTQLIWGKTDLQ